MPNPLNLEGKKFGKLKAIERDSTRHIRSWRCICDCGNSTIVSTNKLTSGHTQSCGCIKALTTVTNGFKNLKHGLGHGKGTRTYKSWLAMRERCRDLSNLRYGGRGINICDRWNSFVLFLEDMGERPEGMTLDRIDVNGNYNPTNCRWASARQQQRNTQRARYLIIGGERMSLMDIADNLGIKKNAAQAFFSVALKLKGKYGYVPDIEGGMPLDS